MPADSRLASSSRAELASPQLSLPTLNEYFMHSLRDLCALRYRMSSCQTTRSIQQVTVRSKVRDRGAMPDKPRVTL